MASLEPPVAEYLSERLGEQYPNYPFLVAVILHLASGPNPSWRQLELAHRVVDILFPETWGRPASSLLVEHPEVLASFFQNADLLDQKSADSVAISRIVMRAIESLREAS